MDLARWSPWSSDLLSLLGPPNDLRLLTLESLKLRGILHLATSLVALVVTKQIKLITGCQEMCGVDNLLKLTVMWIWVVDMLGVPMDIFYYWATTVPQEERLMTA